MAAFFSAQKNNTLFKKREFFPRSRSGSLFFESAAKWNESNILVLFKEEEGAILLYLVPNTRTDSKKRAHATLSLGYLQNLFIIQSRGL